MMDKSIQLLEGQSGVIRIKPTFEGKPIAPNVDVDVSTTDMKGIMALGNYTPSADGKTATIPVSAKNVSAGMGKLVFKYMNAPSQKENVGVSTKTVGLTVLPAQLTVATVNPVWFKWVPGVEYDVVITWKNGTDVILATDPHLTLTAVGDSFSIVSKSATGVRIKCNAAGSATVPPAKEQSIVAKYYSGSASAVIHFAIKPALTIQSTGVLNVGKGTTYPFPFKVSDNGVDVTNKLTNIKANDPNLQFNPDGSFIVLKVNLLGLIKTITYTFDYTVNDLTWSYTSQTTLNIGNLINL